MSTILVNISKGHDVEAFKDWIKETQFFKVLQQETNPATRAFGMIGIPPFLESNEIQIMLRDGVIVKEVEDLPEELMRVFFEQYIIYLNYITNG